MSLTSSEARLAVMQLHPIKSLDGVQVTESRIGPGGGLELDRAWALTSPDGRFLDGKSTPSIHRIRATFSPNVDAVRLSAKDDDKRLASQEFAFPGDTVAASDWFSEYFAQPVIVRYTAEGFPDDTDRNGPTIVSTASLERIADWFPGLDVGESRRRFRTTLELGGVDAFWEDHLFNTYESTPVRFSIGDVNLHGMNPCPRCAVPARDSRSGTDTPGFQKRFSELRQREYPRWARTPDRIRHFYHLAINTVVASSEHGKSIRVGDVVRILPS